ncbi:Scavenger receptor cysteine-rich domain superfamily protein [Geodia barretti]|uniref:Scavenger receptor cysteine-rich domain superfamily protein n=1 Tax=Geodia barretti TaxID=519541 RepID=A0AA35WNP5_GEOBA|nr:Scavenger receptor cysteine-rich domain superfamily protein [Geodia barretti]
MNTDSLLSHEYDVLVQCQEGNDTNEGDIRLVGGTNHWEGRVEVFLSREWGTVSFDYYYSRYYSSVPVVCRQLGYSVQDVRQSCCSVFGEGTGPIQMEYPYCGGGEFRLIDCDYNRDLFQTGYSHSNDWGVFCSIDGQDPWDIRLYGGKLQVYLSEQWQPVANSYSTWTSNNSRVVCRELGFDPYHTDSSSFYRHNTYYPSPPVTTIIDNVTCSGDESSLQSCVHVSTLLSSYPTVGVECLGVDCRSRGMRLAGGGTEAEGRVEVCFNSRWGTVCDNRWNENSTAVACKHLGFSETVNESRYFSSDKFGKGIGPVLIDYINCTGLEGSLLRCNHFTHASGCSHDSDVGVTCMPGIYSATALWDTTEAMRGVQFSGVEKSPLASLLMGVNREGFHCICLWQRFIYVYTSFDCM